MVNKKEAQAYLNRWVNVAEREKKELHASTFNDRLLQTLSLIGLGMSLVEHSTAETYENSKSEKEVRNLWITLKKKMC